MSSYEVIVERALHPCESAPCARREARTDENAFRDFDDYLEHERAEA